MTTFEAADGVQSAQLFQGCPFCERKVPVETTMIGTAWIVGHIHEEHADELPPFDGSGGDQ